MRTGGAYAQFLARARHCIVLEDPTAHQVRDRLPAFGQSPGAWSLPLEPPVSPATSPTLLATAARCIGKRGYEAEATSTFLMCRNLQYESNDRPYSSLSGFSSWQRRQVLA